MNVVSRTFELTKIVLRYGLIDLALTQQGITRLQKFRWINLWGKYQHLSQGERLRLALEAMGPIFIKFGQVLSTRRDQLPAEIADELTKLQDNVPATDTKVIIREIEQALQQPLDTVFSEFEQKPLGSASIAQVHGAVLPTGERVVVKVLRPQVEKQIAKDIALLQFSAKMLEKLWRGAERMRIQEVVVEFADILHKEIDLIHEAANTSHLRRNFADFPAVQIPRVHWPQTRKRVAVYERIEGISLNDVNGLRDNNINLSSLAEKIIEVFFTATFKHGFFHADMHAGNLFVNDNQDLVLVDCGIAGTLSRKDQRYLLENLLAICQRDYQRVAILHIESGWIPSTTRADLFEAAVRGVCEPLLENPIGGFSVGEITVRLFQTARKFDMAIQPQLTLVQKTLLNVEGLARQLDPHINLWAVAQPIVLQWMKEGVQIKKFLKTVRARSGLWSMRLAELPDLVFNSFDNYAMLNQKLLSQVEHLRQQEATIAQARRSSFWRGVVMAVIISATGWIWVDVM